jgi:hypothetical protein
MSEIEISYLNWKLMRHLYPSCFSYVPVSGWRKWIMTALLPVFIGSFFVLSTFSLVLLTKLSVVAAVVVLAFDCGLFICWKWCEGEFWWPVVAKAPTALHVIMGVMMWCVVHFVPAPACRKANGMGVHHYCRTVCFSLITSATAVVATLRSSGATGATRLIAERCCIPAGCVVVISSVALLCLMGREQRRTFWAHETPGANRFAPDGLAASTTPATPMLRTRSCGAESAA